MLTLLLNLPSFMISRLSTWFVAQNFINKTVLLQLELLLGNKSLSQNEHLCNQKVNLTLFIVS